MRGTIGSTESDRNIELPARHHEHVGCVVYDLIERHQRKAPGHELDDRSKPGHGGADSKPSESVFADRRVNDALRSEAFEQTLTDLVSTMIFGHFFAH